MMKSTVFLISLLLLAGCGSAGVDSGQDLQAASGSEAAIAAALEAIDAAAAKGHAWSTSDALLQQARAAAEEGEETRAVELANEARIQAELALVQAEQEAEAWRGRVIGN